MCGSYCIIWFRVYGVWRVLSWLMALEVYSWGLTLRVLLIRVDLRKVGEIVFPGEEGVWAVTGGQTCAVPVFPRQPNCCGAQAWRRRRPRNNCSPEKDKTRCDKSGVVWRRGVDGGGRRIIKKKKKKTRQQKHTKQKQTPTHTQKPRNIKNHTNITQEYTKYHKSN